MSLARHGVEWPAVPGGSKLGEEEEEEEEGDEAYWTHQGPEKETPGRTLAVHRARSLPRRLFPTACCDLRLKTNLRCIV